MYKKEFAQKLRELQKRSGVRQKDLAERLGLSDALVSQFMHGVALPRMEQFRTMLEVMNIPSAEAGKLSFQLMMTRAGSQHEPHQPAVAEPEVIATPRNNHRNSPKVPQPWSNDCHDFFLSEDVDATIPGIPVIMLTDMDVFDHSIPLETYARHRTDKLMKYRTTDLPGTVLILADGNSLALPHCGTLRLYVSDQLPGGNSSLELCGFQDDTFRIIPNQENGAGNWEAFFPVQQFAQEQIRWKLPLLEVGLTPVCGLPAAVKKKNKRSK